MNGDSWTKESLNTHKSKYGLANKFMITVRVVLFNGLNDFSSLI